MKCKVTYGIIWVVIICLTISIPGYAQKEEAEMAERIRSAREEDLVNIDFTEVDIRNLVKFISEVTGRNFVMDEELKGKVTIVSPEPVTIPEAFKIFESVCEVHGYTVVPSGKAYKVVPTRLARTEGVDTITGKELRVWPPGERIITQIVHLNFASAEEVKQLLITLISTDSSMLAYEPTNTLIITDSMANVSRLLEIIREIDRAGTQTQMVRIQLYHAFAETVAQEIIDLLGEGSGGTARSPAVSSVRPRTGTGSGDSGTLIRIVPDTRTNSLLVMAAPHQIQQIVELAEQLDIEMGEIKGGFHVIRLKHASAESTAKVLDEIVNKEQLKPGGTKDLESSLTGKVSVSHDQATNSVIITANDQDFQKLKNVISELDIPRIQVMVEALIVETTMTSLKDIGVEWQTVEQPLEGHYREFGGANFGTLGSYTSETATSLPEGLFFGITKGLLDSGAPNIAVLVQAFQKDGRVNILSTPHLLTLDNEEAEITVGQEVPYQTSFQITQQGSEVNSFDYRDVGVILKLTPHISEMNTLKMNLHVEIKSLITAPSQDELPITSKRQAKTTVMVKNGSTILIGGLIQDIDNITERKIPCFGDIPLLGNLFKRFFQDKSKTNLLIFITPHIIHTSEELEEITRKKREEIDKKMDEAKSRKPFYLIGDD